MTQARNWIRVLKYLTHCSYICYISYIALHDIKKARAKNHCKRTGNGFCTAKFVSPFCQHFSKSNDALHSRRCLVIPSVGLADTPRVNTQRQLSVPELAGNKTLPQNRRRNAKKRGRRSVAALEKRQTDTRIRQNEGRGSSRPKYNCPLNGRGPRARGASLPIRLAPKTDRNTLTTNTLHF